MPRLILEGTEMPGARRSGSAGSGGGDPGDYDPGGYDSFYRRTQGFLVGRARALGAAEDDAADLAQTALIAAAGHWHVLGLRPESERRRFVYRVMFNDLISKGRHKKLQKAKWPVLWNPQPVDSADATVLTNMEARAAFKFIQTLPTNQRRVLVLVWDGWTITEIAEVMRLTSSGVSSHLHEARRKVRKHLEGWQ